MKFIHLQRLIFHGEMDWAAVLQLHVLHVGGELADVAGNDEITRPPHGSANIDGPGNGGVAGDLALEVSADQRVKIEPGKRDVNLAGPVPAKADIAIHVQLGLSKA